MKDRKQPAMADEPSPETAVRTETAEERSRRRVEALLPGGATLAAALVTMALSAPKIPPLQGD